MANSISLVCFDLGGVVLRICQSWAEGCVAAGLEVRGDVDARLAESPEWDGLHGDYQCGRIGIDAFAERLAALIDGLYTPAEIRRVHLAWTLDEYAGVDEVVTRLHDTGLETAVLSNTNHDHWVELVNYPAVARIRNHHASHLIAARKPDPPAYRAIEKTTGRRGAEILFFDDLFKNVDAAAALGWNAVRIDPMGEPAEQMWHAFERFGVLERAATNRSSS